MHDTGATWDTLARVTTFGARASVAKGHDRFGSSPREWLATFEAGQLIKDSGHAWRPGSPPGSGRSHAPGECVPILDDLAAVSSSHGE